MGRSSVLYARYARKDTESRLSFCMGHLLHPFIYSRRVVTSSFFRTCRITPRSPCFKTSPGEFSRALTSQPVPLLRASVLSPQAFCPRAEAATRSDLQQLEDRVARKAERDAVDANLATKVAMHRDVPTRGVLGDAKLRRHAIKHNAKPSKWSCSRKHPGHSRCQFLSRFCLICT